MKRLGVNIDHVATLRNARGESHPDPVFAAKFVNKAGADSITIHLREDRRHINDKDLRQLKNNSQLPINLEMALTYEMIKIAKKIKPDFICLVPEKRNEITTEGGLNLEKISKKKLNLLLTICNSNNIQLSAFINPKKKIIDIAKNLGFHTVELHTGPLDREKVNKQDIKKINEMINYSYKKNLVVNIGHGLNFNNIKYIKNRKKVDTVHIGHFIISEAIFLSLPKVIKIFKNLINL